MLGVNKAEGKQGEAGLREAYALGFDNPLAFSAEHGEGLVDLFDALRPIVEPFMEAGETEAQGDEEEPLGPLKLAIVGRPNAGKSTLINRMIGEDRLITGTEAGITRDSHRLAWAGEKDGEARAIQLLATDGMHQRAEVQAQLDTVSVGG